VDTLPNSSTVIYGYDGASNRQFVTYPDGTYGYTASDALNRPARVNDFDTAGVGI
jgi:uncharacterized protein RhaS with RHS repeats